MRLIRPINIAGSVLAASNVPETVTPLHSADTTYALGAWVSGPGDGTPKPRPVYESLQSDNLGHDPATSPEWWMYIGDVYGAYSYVPKAGDIAYDPVTRHLFRSLVDANNAPKTDATKWVDIGPSNRMAMFDQKTGTQTIRPEKIEVEIAVKGRVDALALLNIVAAKVRISIFDGATEVFNKEVSLTSSAGMSGWYSWLFEPIKRKTDLTVLDLPNVLNPKVRVSVTGGGNIAVGSLVLGSVRKIGKAERGADVGITDHSRIEEDGFGNYQVTRRAYNKRGKYTLLVDNDDVDFVFDLLASFRGTPVVAIGSGNYTSTMMFGLLKDWSVSLKYQHHSLLSIDFQGI